MGNDRKTNDKKGRLSGYMERWPVLSNLMIIIAVAILGIWIAYISMALFTKHGQSGTVPSVENMSYTAAIEKLHEAGFRVEIRDSLYLDDVRPGFVIEQFPKAHSIVKPGRKIFLYINAVHPKEVVLDDDMHPAEDALKGFSLRQGLARLEELGFKNVKVVKVLGDNDCIVKILANGRVVKKTQKVPINANVIVEVYDGRLTELRDSLQNAELYPGGYFGNYEEDSYIPDEDRPDIMESTQGVPEDDEPDVESLYDE